MQAFAAAHLPHQVCLAHDFMAGNIFSVAGSMAAVDGLAIHLGQQDMSDGSHHPLGSAFKQIGKPHQKPALAKSNGVVNVSEGKKLNLQLRRQSAWTQLPVFFMENFEQSLAHSEPRLARSGSA